MDRECQVVDLSLSCFQQMNAENKIAEIPRPSFREAFHFWLKLGFISFGGPAGQIAIMHEFVVEKKKWISESRFLHALNYCMILPGPEAQQLATYIGWLLHGVRGGITAGMLFILPSVFILLGLSIVYVTLGTLPIMTSIFFMMKPAVVAIVLHAMIRIGRRSLKNTIHVAIALVAFICLYFFDVPFPVIILMSFILGMAIVHFIPQTFTESEQRIARSDDERSFVINEYSFAQTPLAPRSFAMVIVAGAALWILPILLLYGDGSGFWVTLITFFSKAAVITFGGAYAVLPYVAETSVEKFHWLTDLQMVDGLAMGESTPGPLIMVLAFVGFMAGYNQFHSSILAASLSLGVTTYYTFLPSFIFILAGAPWVERTKESKTLRRVFSIVTASITGVILNLTLYLGEAVLFSKTSNEWQWLSIAWMVVTFAALYYNKVNLVLWIGISAMAGVLHYGLTIM
jgi:chromate transporter